MKETNRAKRETSTSDRKATAKRRAGATAGRRGNKGNAKSGVPKRSGGITTSKAPKNTRFTASIPDGSREVEEREVLDEILGSRTPIWKVYATFLAVMLGVLSIGVAIGMRLS
jgi:hypothetical protein